MQVDSGGFDSAWTNTNGKRSMAKRPMDLVDGGGFGASWDKRGIGKIWHRLYGWCIFKL